MLRTTVGRLFKLKQIASRVASLPNSAALHDIPARLSSFLPSSRPHSLPLSSGPAPRPVTLLDHWKPAASPAREPSRFLHSEISPPASAEPAHLLGSVFQGALRGTRTERSGNARQAILASGLAGVCVSVDQSNVIQRSELNALGSEPGAEAADAILFDFDDSLQGWSPTSLNAKLGLFAQNLYSSPTALISQNKMIQSWLSLESRLHLAETTVRQLRQENETLAQANHQLGEERDRLEALLRDSLCILCYERQKQVVYGCRHFLVCEQCDKKLAAHHAPNEAPCPFCDAPIQQRVVVISG